MHKTKANFSSTERNQSYGNLDQLERAASIDDNPPLLTLFCEAKGIDVETYWSATVAPTKYPTLAMALGVAEAAYDKPVSTPTDRILALLAESDYEPPEATRQPISQARYHSVAARELLRMKRDSNIVGKIRFVEDV